MESDGFTTENGGITMEKMVGLQRKTVALPWENSGFTREYGGLAMENCGFTTEHDGFTMEKRWFYYGKL